MSDKEIIGEALYKALREIARLRKENAELKRELDRAERNLRVARAQLRTLHPASGAPRDG